METIDIVPLIEQLDDNIDDLEAALDPLLKEALPDIAGKLPLLDQAELYVLVTYAIESTLFSYLRLNGVNAKEHPVFRELSRVKRYFEKIKTVESSGITPNSRLDKAAAGRFITHALGRNQRHVANPAHQPADEKFGHNYAAENSKYSEARNEEPTGSSIDASEDVSDLDHLHVTPSGQGTSAAEDNTFTTDLKKSKARKRRKRKQHEDVSEAVLDANDQTIKPEQERNKKEKTRRKNNV